MDRSSSIRVLTEIAIPLRDGVRTAAEVWLPERLPCAAILVRTPYLKELAAPTALVDARMAAARGYAVVLQDVRGRGDSGGVFEPFVDEEDDGLDSIAWVAAQEWCDGEVVMAGGSYVGMTQWLAAAGRPPGLRAISPALTGDQCGEGWSRTNGVAEHGFLTTWCATELAPAASRMLDEPERSWEDLAAVEAVSPWLRDWLREPADSPYWRARSVSHRRADVEVPALVIGGWYDRLLAASLGSFARSRDARDRLIVGPWVHSNDLSHHVGVANAGVAGAGYRRLFGWCLDFYDAVLADQGFEEIPRVRAYALGARTWLELDAWPPAGARRLELGFDVAGAIGVDPQDPVPSLGGRGLLVQVPGWGFGVVDQRPVAARDDVLVSAPLLLDEPCLLAGPLAVSFPVRAEPGDGEQTWVATLCLRRPDGALHNLVEGVATQAGEGDVEVGLGDCCAWLPAGSELVLLLAGSSFPRWSRPALPRRRQVEPGTSLRLTVAPPALVTGAPAA